MTFSGAMIRLVGRLLSVPLCEIGPSIRAWLGPHVDRCRVDVARSNRVAVLDHPGWVDSWIQHSVCCGLWSRRSQLFHVSSGVAVLASHRLSPGLVPLRFVSSLSTRCFALVFLVQRGDSVFIRNVAVATPACFV
jgi:hypothetical protein